jgi:hypothetical protein
MTNTPSAFTYNSVIQPYLVRATLTGAVEPTTITSVAATGTITYETSAQSIIYSTANATANWTLNITCSKAQPLNACLAVGQTISCVHIVAQGATAYYNNVLQIDGTTVTPKYQGGTAWSAGNASSWDIYTYTITKTADRTFIVFASQTQFK